MEEQFKYKSVHEYLDEVFKDKIQVSRRDIKVAKKSYWRMYNTALKRKRRAECNEVTLTFSKPEIKKLKKKLAVENKLSTSLRQLVLQFLESGSLAIVQQIDNSVIENELFAITEYLEQVLEEIIPIELETIQHFISQIQSFEKSIAQ